jgi:hypothetical protein
MERIMELLREMQAEFRATPPEMKAKWDATADRVMAKWDSRLGEVKACEGTTKVFRKAMEGCEERTEACLEEEKEPALEEPKAVAEPGEVPEGATVEETSGGTEDRTGEQRLAVRRHRQWKKWAPAEVCRCLGTVYPLRFPCTAQGTCS